MRTKLWLGAVAGCLALLALGEGALAGQEPSRTMFTQFIWPGGGAIGVLLLAIDVASIALIVQYFLTIRRAHALPEPRYLVSEQKLEAVPSGGRLLWLVKATLPSGETRTSSTFNTLLK